MTYWTAELSENIEELASPEPYPEDTYLTHYENDVFDEDDCEETDLDEDEMEAAIAAAEAEYDAHVNA